MGAQRAEHSEVVEAGAADCFAVVCAFALYPEWSSSVKKAEVRGPDGGGELVDFEIDAKVKRIRYSLRYFFDEPQRIWWDYVGGDVKSVDGECLFAEESPGCTRVTYRLAIDPGAFVPGPVKRALTDNVMRGWVKELKARVEQR